MTSVRRYLISVLIALLVLTSFLAALQSYRLSADRARELFDQDLQLVAAAIMQQYQADSVNFEQAMAVQLIQHGQIRYRSEQAPAEPILAPEGFSEQNFSGRRWRVYAQSSNNGWHIMVAQPVQQRLQLADEVITASIYPVVLSLPIQALLIWLVVSRAWGRSSSPISVQPDL